MIKLMKQFEMNAFYFSFPAVINYEKLVSAERFKKDGFNIFI